MKQFVTFLFLSFSVLFPLSLFCQDTTIAYSYHSVAFDGQRKLSVFLPKSYFSPENSTKRFVVAYLFDAQFEPYFSMVSSLVSYYEQTKTGIPLIIVGVHTDDDQRWDEFAPLQAEKQHGQNEGSNRLYASLKNEIIPSIDSTYRTSNFRVGIGHSLGGTFLLNQLFTDSTLFQSVIAASPNVTMYQEQIVKEAENYLRSNPKDQRFVFVGVGDVGNMEQNFTQSSDNIDSIMRQNSHPAIHWFFRKYMGKDHLSTFFPTLDDGYLQLSDYFDFFERNLDKISKSKPKNIVASIQEKWKKIGDFRDTSFTISLEMYKNYAKKLYGEKQYTYSKQINQFLLDDSTQFTMNRKDRKSMEESIQRLTMYELGQEGDSLAEKQNFIEAAHRYRKAMAINVVRATHILRMKSVPIFAQAGDFDAAFEQIKLLTEVYQLGGNSYFRKCELCEPLHKDKRWEKWMDRLAKNKKLYK